MVVCNIFSQAPDSREINSGLAYFCNAPLKLFLLGLSETNSPADIYSNQVGKVTCSWEQLFAFAQSCGNSFLPAYVPIAERRQDTACGDRERNFQLYRRGRYVEFNLVYDRGTIFGLQTKGRTESILMSLPPLVRWEYDYKPEPGTPEAGLYEIFLKPQDWINFNSDQ